MPIPIVSIGNLTVGGTGKTPMTQWLCGALTEQGKRVAVLSRGHGGTGAGVRIVSNNNAVCATAAEAGDEPVLLAESLRGVPVLVGKDRRLSAREALRQFALDALVLDDGFQYWQLKRDLDIVLLDAARPFANGFALPRGLLREPKAHLRRAAIAVVTRSEHLDSAGRRAIECQIAAMAPATRVFFASHCPIDLVPVHHNGSGLPLEWLMGRRVVGMCAIAQPDCFFDTVSGAGADIARRLVFSDHARYTDLDRENADDSVRDAGAEALIMTEKDAVKWPDHADSFPAYALRIAMRIENETELMNAVTAHLFRKRQT